LVPWLANPLAFSPSPPPVLSAPEVFPGRTTHWGDSFFSLSSSLLAVLSPFGPVSRLCFRVAFFPSVACHDPALQPSPLSPCQNPFPFFVLEYCALGRLPEGPMTSFHPFLRGAGPLSIFFSPRPKQPSLHPFPRCQRFACVSRFVHLPRPLFRAVFSRPRRVELTSLPIVPQYTLSLGTECFPRRDFFYANTI